MYQLADKIDRLTKILIDTNKELERLKINTNKFSQEVFVSLGYNSKDTRWCLFTKKAEELLSDLKDKHEVYHLEVGIEYKKIFNQLVEEGEIFII